MEDFKKLPVSKLREILQKRNLPVTGKKADLVARLKLQVADQLKVHTSDCSLRSSDCSLRSDCSLSTIAHTLSQQISMTVQGKQTLVQ